MVDPRSRCRLTPPPLPPPVLGRKMLEALPVIAAPLWRTPRYSRRLRWRCWADIAHRCRLPRAVSVPPALLRGRNRSAGCQRYAEPRSSKASSTEPESFKAAGAVGYGAGAAGAPAPPVPEHPGRIHPPPQPPRPPRATDGRCRRLACRHRRGRRSAIGCRHRRRPPPNRPPKPPSPPSDLPATHYEESWAGRGSWGQTNLRRRLGPPEPPMSCRHRHCRRCRRFRR